MARANISTIDDVLPYGVHDRLGGESGRGTRDLAEWLQAGRTLKAELFRHGADEIDSALEQQFAAWATELGASLTRLDYLTPQKLYSVTSTHHELLEKLLQFPGLRTLAPMPIYVAEDIGSQAVVIGDADPKTVPAPDNQTNYPLVGIIDTGIDPQHPMLSAWVAARENYIMPPETDFVHGTFVGGLLAAARAYSRCCAPLSRCQSLESLSRRTCARADRSLQRFCANARCAIRRNRLSFRDCRRQLCRPAFPHRAAPAAYRR